MRLSGLKNLLDGSPLYSTITREPSSLNTALGISPIISSVRFVPLTALTSLDTVSLASAILPTTFFLYSLLRFISASI